MVPQFLDSGCTSILYEAAGFGDIVAAGYVSDKLFQSRRMPVGALGMWGVAISSQAINRNTRELVWSLGYVAAGPMTKQFFYETAAYLAAAIPSGVSAQTTHPARAVLNDYVTPMEMLGSVEINEVCVGMSRSQGNKLSTVADVNRAIESAAEAFKTWSRTPVARRVEPLYKLDALLRENEEKIARLLLRK